MATATKNWLLEVVDEPGEEFVFASCPVGGSVKIFSIFITNTGSVSTDFFIGIRNLSSLFIMSKTPAIASGASFKISLMIFLNDSDQVVIENNTYTSYSVLACGVEG